VMQSVKAATGAVGGAVAPLPITEDAGCCGRHTRTDGAGRMPGHQPEPGAGAGRRCT
jgi:hypothetical protein